MKCSLDRFGNIFKIYLLGILLIQSEFNVVCGFTIQSKRGKDILSDFDYLVSQLYLQHCTFVEIGEGVCSMFVELTLDTGCKRPRPLRKQMFFGNCMCSEFRKWHLCSYPLTQLRPEDCEFQEGTSCPSTSARVHRRLCDVTGMSQWNPQCNCSITLAGTKQEHLCGFKTCYANPMPMTICGPRTVCGTAHCDVGEHGSLYSVRCDRRCRHHQPFCEDPCPATSLKRSVSSQWAEWKSVSSPEGEGSMQQFETECLDEKNEPAFDCLGPGLLCCSKEDTDCICEVKMQYGKLKAFRYMIKFGDNGEQCETKSKLKVRSTGLRGDAKVWDRFIDVASGEDNKSDSISMFGKPVGFEAYLRKSRPEEHKEIVAENMKVALQNTGKLKDGILQQLVMLMTNRSQGVRKSSEKLNVSDRKIVQSNSLKGEPGNGTMKLVSEVPVTQTLNLVKTDSPDDKQRVNSNTNQLQTISNNSKSFVNPTLQNQQKDTLQTDKLSDEKNPNHLTPLTYQNITNKAKILERNSSNEKIMAEGVKNVSHDVNEKPITNAKSLEERSKIYEHLNTNNAKSEQKNNSMEKLDKNNHEKESDRAMIDGYREISNNSSVNTKDMSKAVASNDQSSRNTNFSSENSKEKIQSSLQHLETNTENKITTYESKIKETDNNREKPESIKHNENLKNVLTGQEASKDDKKLEGKINDDSQRGEGEVFETKKQGKKIENDRQENDSTTERARLHSTISNEKSPDDKSKVDIQNSQEQDPKDETKINTDNSKENPSQNSEKIERVANKQEFLLGGILVSDNKAKGQENSSVDEEDNKAELKENEYQLGVVSPQGNQTNNEQGNKEIEHSVTSKLINPEFTNTAMKLSSKGDIATESLVNNPPTDKLMSSIAKGSAFTMAYKPTESLSQPKQININNVSNNVSDTLTSVGLQNSNISQTNGKNQQNSQNSQLIGTEKPANILQKNNNSSVISSPNKEQSIKKQALDEKVKFNDIANIFPNYNPDGITVPSMSSKHRPKPDYLREVGQTGITLNIQTMTTPDLLGAIAKKLFKSNPLNDPNDPLRMLSESNPSISLPEEKQSHDYDEPEPVLKDLNKVDRENVDEKMAEALSKLADLKELEGKVEWSEKSENNDIKLDFGKEKKLEDKENVSPSENMPTLSVGDVKKKRRRRKFKKN